MDNSENGNLEPEQVATQAIHGGAVPGGAVPGGVVPGGAGPQGDGPEGPEQRTAEERVNKTIIVSLGIALLAVVGGLSALSLLHKGVTLPDGLTSLASLIAGGLLAFLNPLSKRPSKANIPKASSKGNR